MYIASALSLAFLLLLTAASKYISPGAFLTVLDDIVPNRYVSGLYWGVIVTEIAIAGALLVAPSLGAVLVLFFVVGATLAISVRLSKRRGFSCGCWGGKKASSQHVPGNPILSLARLLTLNMLIVQIAIWIFLTDIESWSILASVYSLALVPVILGTGIAIDLTRRRRRLTIGARATYSE
jgi:hypothetical protein